MLVKMREGLFAVHIGSSRGGDSKLSQELACSKCPIFLIDQTSWRQEKQPNIVFYLSQDEWLLIKCNFKKFD